MKTFSKYRVSIMRVKTGGVLFLLNLLGLYTAFFAKGVAAQCSDECRITWNMTVTKTNHLCFDLSPQCNFTKMLSVQYSQRECRALRVTLNGVKVQSWDTGTHVNIIPNCKSNSLKMFKS